MGCNGSASAAEHHAAEPDLPMRARSSSGLKSIDSRHSSASELSDQQNMRHHTRLEKLKELDAATKVPFILVELRGCGNRDGYVEVCGKDEYGVYMALDHWLENTWKCKLLEEGAKVKKDQPVPFCDRFYRWEEFVTEGSDGTSNMGLATMQLVDFMCNTLCWTLGVINGGNVGQHGEVREQQVIFKAPHPMNMVASHMMIELRSAGYIEVCGTDRKELDVLHFHLIEEYRASPVPGHEKFCHRFYKCGPKIFKERGKEGENNVGLLTVKVCDTIVEMLPGWSLVTMNGGNYGEDGQHREQQLVFRCDHHPLREAPHLMVEMREVGYIEICGRDEDAIYKKLTDWLIKKWYCKETVKKDDDFCDKKLKWPSKDFMEAAAELTAFFHELGWQLQVCSQGTVIIKGRDDCREQQMLFRPGASGHGVVEPHLFFELYTGEGDEDLYKMAHVTQTLANQFVRVKQVGDCKTAMAELTTFLSDYLGGERLGNSPEGFMVFATDCFLSRGFSDNNLGAWTMRFCDFMVDRLGWSFVVCNVCNLGLAGQIREQQLVFRFDGERREVPIVKFDNNALCWTKFPGLTLPDYWKCEEVIRLRQVYATSACEQREINALQSMFDHTFKRVLTRDRVYEFQLGHAEEMPYRLEVVHAFRSEHAELYRRFAEVSDPYTGGTPIKALTTEAPEGGYLANRLRAGEALLAHGTNPSSAMGILKTGFALNHAGKTTGTMFGFGIYLAECVSKSDEYARDDQGGTYPGLMAMLICRCLVGKPYVVTDAGDYIAEAKAGGYNCVVGDREQKVGTYKEFIFFDERQVYPEYTVIYRRQYDQDKVPDSMRQNTKGTTGKNWQVQVEKGWANVPADVSYKLTKAEKDGVPRLDVEINDVTYTFDLTIMKQTNLSTKKTRSIRPPKRR